VGNLLLGATHVVPEHPLDTPFGCSYQLDIAVMGSPISQRPLLVGGIEIERWHHFDGRKALIGRSMGFPLITVDITELELADLTEEWAARVLTDTTRSDAQGRRSSYVYLHDLLYPQFAAIPKDVEDEPKHQYLVFADDPTLDWLRGWLRRLGDALAYDAGQVLLQRLNTKSQSARVALETAGSIVGTGWEAFNNQRMLRVSVPRPSGPHDKRSHKLHATLARLLLSRDCLVGSQYASAVCNDEPEEDVWLRYKRRPEQRMHEVYRVLPKRPAEPVGQLLAFLQSIGPGAPECQTTAE